MIRSPPSRRCLFGPAAALMLACLVPGLSFARDVRHPAGAEDRGEEDHERARRALIAGEVRPLAEILTIVRPKLDGDIVEVELQREDGRYVYEFKVLTRTGRLREFLIDPKSGEILAEEHD